MFKVIIGDIVYLYDNMKDARKAFHIAVTKNGINNVKVTYQLVSDRTRDLSW